ncbi:MAG: ABC transporter ATP-binding protein [Actinomycetota bacterium]
MSIRVDRLSKTFEARGRRLHALRDLSLQVPDGQMLVVVGPSGSGKTTLLRCIAGLEEPDDGRIEVGGRDVAAAAPGDRDVAMVFQDYALYPHLSVRENIAFGLRARGAGASEIETKVREAARIISVEHALDRSPSSLSGGERQRVALARALVRKPAAFLLDEPLSNLDAELRAQTRLEIRELQSRLQVTTLYVTHDQVEAMTMGDVVAVLRDGRVEQIDTPSRVYDSPANTFVARFLGNPPMNVFPAKTLGLALEGGYVGIRPERIGLVEGTSGRLNGAVSVVENIGGDAVVHVAVGDERLLVRCDVRAAPATGTHVGLMFADADLHRFDDDGKAAR